MRYSAALPFLLASAALGITGTAYAHQHEAAAAPAAAPATPEPATPDGATPASQLAAVPADAERFLLVSSAGRHGQSARWTTPNGDRMYRESMNLRGQVFEQDARFSYDANRQLTGVDVRGFTPQGNAAETFSVDNGTAHWHSQTDEGSAAAAGRHYLTIGGPFLSSADLAEALFAAPAHQINLLPSGTVRMEQLSTLRVGSGTTAKDIQLWVVTGLGIGPTPLWMDGARFFGFAGGITLLPAAYEADHAALTAAQEEALTRFNASFVERFGRMPETPVAFTGVRLFDAMAGAWRENQTVVVNGAVIDAVGTTGEVQVPANARVINGAGKTLVPGLWDAHMHFSSDFAGPMLLSIGVTSARDPGADVQPALARQRRMADGGLLAPTLFTSVLIDGAGPLAAQGGVTVNSAEEAVAAVRAAHDAGFHAVKFYTSMQPAWLRAGAAEAHRLGMHIHGHVPATMRAMDAIDAGYDEITHINFIAMQAMPDSVVNVSNGFARFEGPGRYARSINLDAPPITTLLSRMAANSIYSDPTLVAFEGLLADERGHVTRALAAYEQSLPSTMQRSLYGGGFAPPADLTRADYQASFARLVELVGHMQRAGVPIVAGTDGFGLELVHELELYVSAGLTPAQALQTATINVARLVGAANTTGSITPGKEADLVLVDGDPSQNIGDLRHTDWVMSDGRLMNADDLRAAVGFNGRPR